MRRTSWNKGKSSWSKGKHLTKEHRGNIAKALEGNVNGKANKGKIVPKEIRLKISKKVKQNYIDRPELIEQIKEKRKLQTPVYESKHEKLVQNELAKRKIPFKKHRYMKEIEHSYQCDIFIEPNVVIEVDGEYWHNLPGRKEMDEIRTLELLREGFAVFRVMALQIMDKNYKINWENLNEFITEVESSWQMNRFVRQSPLYF